MPKKKFSAGKNLATYNHATGLYHNKSGTFVTLAEANEFAWKCEKCGLAFRTVVKLHDHRDASHSY
jgi:hypothetical protein